MDEQNKNLLLATGLSFLVLLIWMAFFAPEPPDDTSLPGDSSVQTDGTATLPAAPPAEPADAGPGSVITPEETRAAALSDAPRITIDTPRLEGSISLVGGRIDDLKL